MHWVLKVTKGDLQIGHIKQSFLGQFIFNTENTYYRTLQTTAHEQWVETTQAKNVIENQYRVLLTPG